MSPDEGGAEEAVDALLEESVADLYDNAPCGYLSTRPDGTIVKVNETFLAWTGHTREGLVDRKRFSDLLSVGGRIYHETHFAPLLQMQGKVSGIALEVVRTDGSRLPVLVSSIAKSGPGGEPLLIRTTFLDATDRREYERELLRARDRERDVARALQQSLLAGAPPDDPRLAVATHYSPAIESLEVGGDWHEAFRIDDDRIGVVVGDVVGRGLAAAAAMGQMRSAILALAGVDPSPAALLTRLDAFVERVEAARMATVAYAEVDLGRGRMRYACAGHPPPALVPPGEPPRLLWDGRSAPLGVMRAGSARAEAALSLQPGSRLVLFTDGLVERRDRTLDDGLERLLQAIAARRDLPVPALVGYLPQRMLADAGSDDDVCLLALELH